MAGLNTLGRLLYATWQYRVVRGSARADMSGNFVYNLAY